MRLRIDGCDVSLDLAPGSTFGAVLAEAGRKVVSQGRVVSRIVADGREISTRFEREMADRPVGEVDTVDVTTTTPDALFREALDGAIDLSLTIRRDVETTLSSLRAGDLAAILTNLERNDVLFIDEIHRLSPVVEEILYPAMEDFQLDIMIGEGPGARSIKIDLPPFTLVGATTRAGLLTSPLRDRFGIVQRLEFYGTEELQRIVERSARILGVPTDEAGAARIAGRSRGTPRIANRLLRRVRDFAEVKAQGRITDAVAQAALDLLDVDPRGFDPMDRRLMLTIIEKFDGGPVGVDSLAAALGEERGTIEDVIEPFLIQQGFIMRTARGRVATRGAYLHFGLTPPAVERAGGTLGLFDA